MEPTIEYLRETYRLIQLLNQPITMLATAGLAVVSFTLGERMGKVFNTKYRTAFGVLGSVSLVWSCVWGWDREHEEVIRTLFVLVLLGTFGLMAIRIGRVTPAPVTPAEVTAESWFQRQRNWVVVPVCLVVAIFMLLKMIVDGQAQLASVTLAQHIESDRLLKESNEKAAASQQQTQQMLLGQNQKLDQFGKTINSTNRHVKKHQQEASRRGKTLNKTASDVGEVKEDVNLLIDKADIRTETSTDHHSQPTPSPDAKDKSGKKPKKGIGEFFRGLFKKQSSRRTNQETAPGDIVPAAQEDQNRPRWAADTPGDSTLMVRHNN